MQANSSETLRQKLAEIQQNEVNRQKQMRKMESDIRLAKDKLNRAKPEKLDVGPFRERLVGLV